VFSRKDFFSSAGDTDDISTSALEVLLELCVCVGLGVCVPCKFHYLQALHAHANTDINTRKMLHKNASNFVRIYLYMQAFLCGCLYYIVFACRVYEHTNGYTYKIYSIELLPDAGL